ncbi:MAG TPA: polyprenyl diphosphate synthase [Acetobacteraceae bacterium]|jgi:short-chain Z-isoprenyl diphosphate synthase|nr:polyprenyl diphosphate synthase [Acetobacteraceae bacterium]
MRRQQRIGSGTIFMGLERLGKTQTISGRSNRTTARYPAPGGLLAVVMGWFWRAAYRIYEQRLAGQVSAGEMPRHVGIILDGNRRHALARGVQQPETVYRAGAAKLDDVIAWSISLGIPMITLWVFSLDNLRRSESEVSGIFTAVEHKLRALAADGSLQQHGVHLTVVGRREVLPPGLVEAIEHAEAVTRDNHRITLNLAVGYGGREEIVDALRSLLTNDAAQGLTATEAAAAITPEAISAHLYRADLPDPDLIIRTSGEARLSGFLLWQSVHSELYFCDVNWPAMRRIDYLRAIRSYQRRERRFGA